MPCTCAVELGETKSVVDHFCGVGVQASSPRRAAAKLGATTRPVHRRFVEFAGLGLGDAGRHCDKERVRVAALHVYRHTAAHRVHQPRGQREVAVPTHGGGRPRAPLGGRDRFVRSRGAEGRVLFGRQQRRAAPGPEDTLRARREATVVECEDATQIIADARAAVIADTRVPLVVGEAACGVTGVTLRGGAATERALRERIPCRQVAATPRVPRE